MATLNLNEKKIPSAENLRLLSSLILSLSSKQGAIENKLINNWVASTAYIKDESFVIYDELLYVCKISNADDTFDKNKWTCLSPVIEELTKADIEALVNLTPEQITNLQSLIDDTSISTTHTNSSSHIYMAIQDAIAECKNDTLKQIAKKVSGSYKIANTTADIVSADYIYLLSNGTNYDLYVLVDGTATKVGDTNIDLSEYVKTTDLADYMKTSDADGKFATITTVDSKVDKTSILTSLDNSATDEQVYSASIINAELDGVVKKTDISTTINSTSTDDTVPSAKAIYNKSKNKITSLSNGEDIIAYADSISKELVMDTVRLMNGINCPYGVDDNNNDFYYTIYNIADDNFKRIVAYDIRKNDMYMIMKNLGVWGKWQKLCTTSVADSSGTGTITPAGTTGEVYYKVINGICYVSVSNLAQGVTGLSVCSITGLPKTSVYINSLLDLGGTCVGSIYCNEGESTFISLKPLASGGYCSFSYPVAES